MFGRSTANFRRTRSSWTAGPGRRDLPRRGLPNTLHHLFAAARPRDQTVFLGELNVLEPDHQPRYRFFVEFEYDFYRRLTTDCGLIDAFRTLHPQLIEHSWSGAPATATARDVPIGHRWRACIRSLRYSSERVASRQRWLVPTRVATAACNSRQSLCEAVSQQVVDQWPTASPGSGQLQSLHSQSGRSSEVLSRLFQEVAGDLSKVCEEVQSRFPQRRCGFSPLIIAPSGVGVF